MARKNPFGGKKKVPYGPGATPSGKPPSKRSGKKAKKKR